MNRGQQLVLASELGRAEVEVGTSGRFVLFEGAHVLFEGRELGVLAPSRNELEERYRFQPQDGPAQSLVGTLEAARWMIAEGVRRNLTAEEPLPPHTYEPWLVAIHEAGHAVAAVKLRTGLSKASIVADDHSEGRVLGSTLLRGKSIDASPERFVRSGSVPDHRLWLATQPRERSSVIAVSYDARNTTTRGFAPRQRFPR